VPGFASDGLLCPRLNSGVKQGLSFFPSMPIMVCGSINGAVGGAGLLAARGGSN
jgi:hypothetical protein